MPTYFQPPAPQDSGALEASQIQDKFVETYDWIVPNVTCTSTWIRCPLPDMWAHLDYVTPSMYPDPAEGNCHQQKEIAML